MPVHPHGCGERGIARCDGVEDGGSSPRLWGTLWRAWAGQKSPRFIPTAVGNAGTHLRSAICRTVHPHGCGERIGSKIVLPSIIGSSPRLWGTPPERRQCRHWQRFIPTAVGNAACARYPALYKAVHPHGCGERRLFGWPISNMIGSSPRLWGTLLLVLSISLSSRFIPTAVGNAHFTTAT